MKHARILPTLALVPMLCATAFADARYKSKTEMIQTAQAIAIVDITRTEKASAKGKFWTYGQKATAKVEKPIKGGLSGEVPLFSDENFICARCHFEPGRYLVFLDRDGDLLTGNNWHLSARKIGGDTVKWFAGGSVFEEKDAPLASVLDEIEQASAKPE